MNVIKVIFKGLNSALDRCGTVAIGAIIVFFVNVDLSGDITQLKQSIITFQVMSYTLLAVGIIDFGYNMFKHYYSGSK